MSCNGVVSMGRSVAKVRWWGLLCASLWAAGCGEAEAPCVAERTPCRTVVHLQFATSLAQAASYEVLIEGAGATVQCTIELDGEGKATSLVSCTEPAHWLQGAHDGRQAQYVGVALEGEHNLLQVTLKRGGAELWTREVRPNYAPSEASCGACGEAVVDLEG